MYFLTTTDSLKVILADTTLTAQEKTAVVAEQVKNMTFSDILSMLAEWGIEIAAKIAIALAIYFVGRWLIGRLVKIVNKVCEKRGVEISLQQFFKNMIKVVLYICLALTVIGILGIDTTSLIAMFASASLAIGMALSGTMQNFAGGVMILLLRPYRIGDYVEAQGQAGTIKEISLFNTVITTVDNQTIYVPNSSISTGIINNYSQAATRRVDWNVTISYGDDVEVARRVLIEMMNSDKRVKQDPAPVVYLTSLGDSAVNISARAWVDNADYWGVYFDLNERIYNELPKHGLHFPFPQLSVHVEK
ncbi:MAG: mechanosensitive ion channel family protein [Rikenellaceae bacterium]|nr:mechanosensitive ion channel family protein [Rikenellaceae bacterium]